MRDNRNVWLESQSPPAKIYLLNFSRSNTTLQTIQEKKLAPISTGPHEVPEVDYKTCLILRDDRATESILLYVVFFSPQLERTTPGDTQERKNTLKRIEPTKGSHKCKIISLNDKPDTPVVITRSMYQNKESRSDTTQKKLKKSLQIHPTTDYNTQ